MHQSQVHESNNVSLSESQIYDDLSQIIKSFKLILTSMQNICATLYRYEPINSLMEDLKETMKGLYGYVRLYSTPVDNHSQHRNTFHRFICRLIESISAYKVKFQNLPYFSFLAGDINIIEQGVISYQQERNIGAVIKKLQAVINRFCNKMIKKYEACMKTVQNEGESQQDTGQEKGEVFPAIGGEYHLLQKDQVKGIELVMSMEVKPSKKAVQSKSESSLNRVMNLLTRRFKSMSCLDIQYNDFKQFFFRSRDSKQQLFDDCLQRNSFIYKEMLRYSRQFTEYLQRKELKLYRKNKFVDSLMMTTGGGSNRVRRVNNNNNHNNGNSNGGHQQEVGYNFTKKRVNNYNHFLHQQTNNQHIRKVIYGEVHTENNSTYQERNLTTGVMEKTEFSDGRDSHLRSIEQDDSCGRFVSQLIVSPLLSEKAKQHTPSRDKQYEQKFQDMTTETLLEFTKRKKNLQLKKIDISLTTFSVGGEVQTAKAKTKLLNAQVFKKTPVQSIKHFDQKFTTSIRKNYLHKKYEQAMKKNLNDTLENENQLEKIEQQQPCPTQYSSSVKCIDPEGQQSPSQVGKDRKYFFKTSNKRNSNGGAQYKSLNHPQRKDLSTTNKNFRKLKMEQQPGDKVERLERMKEMALNHMQLRSGGRAIRPTFMYRQREATQHPYIQITAQDFSDANIVPYRQVQ